MTEENYWRQRYEMLMANLGDMVRAATAKQPVLLADKESYELGKLHGEIGEREACAKMFDGVVWAYDYREIAAAIRARGQA
jgi:hypothetical protein